MKTFNDVVSEVLRYGFNDGPQVNKARIEDWVNEAQLQVARHSSSPEFQENAAVTLVVGTKNYGLPTGCLRIESIAYTANEARLRPVDIQTFDSYAVSEFQSPPTIYAVYKNELLLWPTPSAADELKVRYTKRPARLTGAEVPTLGEDYLHLLVDYSLMRAYRAEDDLEAATQWQTEYEHDLKQYELDTNMQMDDRPKQLQGTWGG